MKIRVLSDLHTEFAPLELDHAGEQIMVLAGDIGIECDGVRYAKTAARRLGIPVLVLAGNHEFYRTRKHPQHFWETLAEDCRREADHTSVLERGAATFLENGTAEYNGLRFIGCTLWTDMKLFGEDPFVESMVWRSLMDYRAIISKETGEPLTPERSILRHLESRKFLHEELAKPYPGKTVVVTHHSPSWLSVSQRFRDDKVSAGFSSRLEQLILKYDPSLFCHGHTHDIFDYTIGDTRVVCNPRGYPGENTNFDPSLIIEI